MTGWIIFIVSAVIVLTCCLPVGIQAEYGGQQLLVRLKVGPLRISLYPVKKKERSVKAGIGKESSVPSDRSCPKLSPEKLIHLLRLIGPEVWGLLLRIQKRLRVDRLHLKLTIGGTDPADVVLCYGRIYAAVGTIWQPMVEQLHIRDGRIHMGLDFERSDCKVEGDLALSLRVFVLIGLALCIAGKGIRIWNTLRQEDKTEKQDRKAA